MFYASIRQPDGKTVNGIYHSFPAFYADTFSPEADTLEVIELKTHGKTYADRKKSVRSQAVDWSFADTSGLYWADLAAVGDYFKKNGKRYGLLEEFKENGII